MIATYFSGDDVLVWAVVATRKAAQAWVDAQLASDPAGVGGCRRGCPGRVYTAREAPLDARGLPRFPAGSREADALARRPALKKPRAGASARARARSAAPRAFDAVPAPVLADTAARYVVASYLYADGSLDWGVFRSHRRARAWMARTHDDDAARVGVRPGHKRGRVGSVRPLRAAPLNKMGVPIFPADSPEGQRQRRGR